MRLTGLTSVIARLPEIDTLASTDGRRSVYGLLEAARPAVLSALAGTGDRTVLVVTPTAQRALDWSAELPSWLPTPTTMFPAIEALPYERVRLDRQVLAQRESVLRDLDAGLSKVVVAPVRALLQPVRPKQTHRPGDSVLQVGDTVAVDTLLRSWVALGYTESPLVHDEGGFARRGGVLDVFPAGSELPVRLELFGNEIESIRTYDPVTQRSVANIRSVVMKEIAPLDDDVRRYALEELLGLDVSGLTAEAETAWLEDLSRLENGASYEDLNVFAPYFLREPSCLAQHLPAGSLVCIDVAGETWRVLEDLHVQAEQVQKGMQDAGALPRGVRTAVLSPGAVRSCISTHSPVEFHNGSGEGEDAIDLTGLFTPAKLYAGRVRDFVQDLERQKHEAIVVTSHQHERVSELLRDEPVVLRACHDLDGRPDYGVTLLPASLAEGWRLGSQRISLLTDHELFGRARSRPVARKTRPAREAFFAQFAPGDYVVHLEHGIGRFQEVTRMSIEGVEREYAVVHYAGTDKVYVPTDQLERLTRYIGAGDAAPQLNRLGGGEWQRARTRARQAAADIARDLIDLYSKRRSRAAHAFGTDTPWQHELESSFPYPETPDQLRAVEDVKTDMEAPHPMDRLVCADVGYGKTEVAVRAAFKAAMDGKQIAVLVPTTILAQQHYETFSDRFAAFPLTVEVLSRFRTPAQQREILARVASGEVDILIGTHRILQKDVRFKNLGLLIIDEEQRFGVKHKEHLKKLRETIDVLTLTATPIPRTLHMGLVGIREISIIETPPEGRLPIKTYLQPFNDRLVREAILRELDRGGQIYFVHNKVATIDAMAERIRALVPEARLLVAHGQMDEDQLEKVMMAFAHEEADVLLCSTIIENGLDIPNVNTIVVNNAQRLGLTQLYQLRGRVGRGANQAYAYLLYPLDARISFDAQRRMEAVFEAQDLGAGMTIAMKDLELRGVGNLLGAEQSGTTAAIGFDLYTRLIGEAVERLRGVQVDEPSPVTLDLPLTMYLPVEYVNSEAERLTLYRRMAGIETFDGLEDMGGEMRDRFGPLPDPVKNLFNSVRVKLLGRQARVTSISVNRDWLTIRAEPTAMYDRVSLLKRYGNEARISTNVLRIPRSVVAEDWLGDVEQILRDMVALRDAVTRKTATPA